MGIAYIRRDLIELSFVLIEHKCRVIAGEIKEHVYGAEHGNAE